MARAPTGYNQCITAVEQAAGRELSKDELDNLFTRLQGRVRRYQSSGLNETDAYVRAGRELGDEMRLKGVLKKREKLNNEMRKRERLAELGDSKEAGNLRAMVAGREGIKEQGGKADSTSAKVLGMQQEILGPFSAELKAAGLTKILSRGDRAFERQVIRELAAVEKGEGPVTTNTKAREAAEIINKAQENVRLLLNKAGAWIGKAEQYLFNQSHDMMKVRQSFADWFNYILPRLDERTFDSLDVDTPEARREFLQRVWKALSDGVHDRASGAGGFGEMNVGTGPANLAKRISQSRTLIFKDADARADYHEMFGKGTFIDSVNSSLQSGARNIALMRDWGTNPEAMYDTVKAAAVQRAHDRGDFKEVDKLRSKFTDRVFDVVTGKAAVPENATASSITAFATALQSVTKLGGVLLSSFNDFGNTAATLRHNGVPLFEAYGNQLRAFLPKGAAAREAADMAGVGIEAMNTGIINQFTTADMVRGRAAKLVDTFHKLNGLTWWTNNHKYGVGMMLMHNMARMSTQAFDTLPVPLQRTFARYGIEAADWDVARQSAVRVEGKNYVLPQEITDPKVRSKFYTYVADQVSEAVNEPGAYARALSTWGTQAGTGMGAAVRILMQFKTYPITFMTQTMRREFGSLNPMSDQFLRGRTGDIDVAGMAHLVASLTILGYASFEMKNLFRGQDTRTSNADTAKDWSKIIMASMVQGGGLGLYGDFLFGDSSRLGAGPVLSLAGPTVGTADNIIKLLQQAVHGAAGDERAARELAPNAIRLARDNIAALGFAPGMTYAPLLNMFYSRAIMDHLIWHRLQEAVNPGYLARYEERMRRENDVTFWMRPTDSPYR